MMLFSIFVMVAARTMYFLLYLSGNGSFPQPLSAKEEKEYLILLRNGDAKAKQVLIEKNLRLVAHIIKKYYSGFKEQEDLISIGTIGLIKAISTYDINKGARLATYAARCIENEILMYFRSLKKQGSEVSMYDHIDVDRDGNSLVLMDIIPMDDTIADDVDIKIKAEKLKKFIETALEPREREIILLRYALYSGEPYTQREVAAKLGISRSYVYRPVLL